jgi:hypothetical protein
LWKLTVRDICLCYLSFLQFGSFLIVIERNEFTKFAEHIEFRGSKHIRMHALHVHYSNSPTDVGDRRLSGCRAFTHTDGAYLLKTVSIMNLI